MAEAGQIETGYFQSLDNEGKPDWRGVVIRGDQAMQYAGLLETVLTEKQLDWPTRFGLERLMELLQKANQYDFPDEKIQQVRLTTS